MYNVITYYVGLAPTTTSHKTRNEAVKVLSSEVKEAQGYYKGTGYKKSGTCADGYIVFRHEAFGVDFSGRIEKVKG